MFPNSQLSGGAGPGVLLTRLPTPLRRASGRGRGGGVSGSSRRFRSDGWTDRGATNWDGFAVLSSEELDPWVRRRWWIRSLTDAVVEVEEDDVELNRSFWLLEAEVRSV